MKTNSSDEKSTDAKLSSAEALRIICESLEQEPRAAQSLKEIEAKFGSGTVTDTEYLLGDWLEQYRLFCLAVRSFLDAGLSRMKNEFQQDDLKAARKNKCAQRQKRPDAH